MAATDNNLPAQWIDRCRARDEGAWNLFHQTYFDFVCGVALRLRTPSSELDDVCQDTFLIALLNIATFRGGNVSAWLRRIVTSVVVQRRRRWRQREALSALWIGSVEENAPQQVDHEHDVTEARAWAGMLLARMSPKKRQVFNLFELEGFSTVEIAERLGCKSETVRTRLHYARKELERLVKHHCRDLA